MKSRLIILILLVFSFNSEAQVRRTTIRAFWQTIRNTITREAPPTPIIEKALLTEEGEPMLTEEGDYMIAEDEV